MKIFKKSSRTRKDLKELEGVITFFGSHYAIRAFEILKREGLEVVIIPGPREISPNCGVALRFNFNEKGKVEEFFQKFCIHYEAIHFYPEK